jgi:7,8-dihydropterin-6-yl-methyl-4-(beta-D-ribofuranosyl)aminobenzene 5'-phosphate synthase
MKKRIILILCLAVFTLSLKSQQNSEQLLPSELASLNKALIEDTLFAQVVNRYGGDAVQLYDDFKLKIRKSDSAWIKDQEKLQPLDNIGYTEHFEMIPLIDWFTKDDNLIGEAGVSYLIRTDDVTILFDVGFNQQNSDPSPLLHNMKELGVSLDEIDVIVISHNHNDHVGGKHLNVKNTFTLTKNQIDLGQKIVYTPIPMKYPGLKPICSKEPVKIAKGVATIGVIPCPLFFSYMEEQALAINVKNKGIVVITGCGHQTIEKLIVRSELLFNESIYGLLGGFHLPVSLGRNIDKTFQYGITGRTPWNPLTIEDIQKNIDFFKNHEIKIVGISGHDSCDESINSFKKAFKNNYFDIAVGQSITLDE